MQTTSAPRKCKATGAEMGYEREKAQKNKAVPREHASHLNTELRAIDLCHVNLIFENERRGAKRLIATR